MTETITRTTTTAGSAATDAAGAAGAATAPIIREAAQQLLGGVGKRVLDAAIDRAVSTVEDVTSRLENVTENGGTGLRSALTGKPPEQTEPADAHADQQEPGGDAKPGLGARLGAAFSLLLRKAQQLLQFLAQQALRGLQALQHLTGRGDDQDQADEHDQTEDQADGDQEELDHADEQDEARDRRADDGQGTRRRVAAR